MQALQRSLLERLIRERQSRLKGLRARVDIDINGSQQPYAEAMTQLRIVSWFIAFISPSGGLRVPANTAELCHWQKRSSHEVVGLAPVCESEPTLRHFNSAASTPRMCQLRLT